MALYEKRLQARELRKAGESILYIARELGISKSSASFWCSDIKLTDSQVRKLSKRHKAATLKGRMIGAQANRKKKLDAIEDGRKFGKNYIKNTSDRDLILIATALYWAEGAKGDRTFGFQFINSDPDMILLMRKFLSLLKIKDEDIACTIQINEVHKGRISEVLKFWKNLLKLQNEQMGNTSFVKTISKKIYENHETYYGICRLRVIKSSMLKYKVLGLITALKSNTLSA